ncbi:hypothetical protein PF004_g3907 [Phytophthora fragariae]|uniref:Clathrin/coatomer adaptor adaptin-like N-terminal domain-containing protein n=2 Tax=Phytophthora fragariae TaxID=53985 RepID=A0A6G0PK61_9STRA|nr:hypothetical protein PF004_g3907 [Phytophthora fragariae]
MEGGRRRLQDLQVRAAEAARGAQRVQRVGAGLTAGRARGLHAVRLEGGRGHHRARHARLQHANSAVVLSAVKVIMKFLEKVSDADTERSLSRKMAPPLVPLLSADPEIQYVALHSINLIVQKGPAILANEIKVFFCKYNDPIYVKMNKLEIIIRLVSETNIEQVLLEFKESATEVNVEFVCRSVRAIDRCAVKLERAAEKCINVLLELIQTKMNYIVQEAINVIILANWWRLQK